jgi:hypothetical protein
MFSYVSLSTSTSNIAGLMAFYNAMLMPLRHMCISVDGYNPNATSAAWGLDHPGPHLWVTQPFEGCPASVGSRVMVSFLAPNQSAIYALFFVPWELPIAAQMKAHRGVKNAVWAGDRHGLSAQSGRHQGECQCVKVNYSFTLNGISPSCQ